MKVQIKGTQYSRDLKNMAVLCTDRSVVDAYQTELRKHMDNKRRDQEINNLKLEISEIKSMLKTLIDRG